MRCYDEYGTTCTPPKLGSRPFSTTSGSGFYSKEDYKDIVSYAKDRHIEIIPEIMLFGRSSAAVIAMKARDRVIEHYRNHGNAGPEAFTLQDNETVTQSQSFINPCLASAQKYVCSFKLHVFYLLVCVLLIFKRSFPYLNWLS